MKTSRIINRFLPGAFLFAVLLISGCATAPPVDWNSRVGHYTYPQAINEFGPPNRQAHLSNGATEVKWFVPAVGTIGTPNNNLNNGFGVGPNNNPGYYSDRYLQLTFDSNGVLTDWSKNY